MALPALGALLWAQETRSVIFGRVLDPQSAAVADAAVTITHTDTNTVTRLTTNETGYYEASLLLPGNYQVAVETTGFKKSLRSGIVLRVGTNVEVSFQLELGALAETVSVTAEAPLLDTSSVSTGRVIDNRTLMDLPVLGNSAILLVKLTPGVETGGVNNYLGLHSNIGGSDYHTAGGVGGNEWSIDGVPNNGSARHAAYLPYTDTLQEFKVETSGFDASIGHTTGISVAMMTKAGTNDFHGSLTEQHWQQRWNGTPFFQKQLYYRQIAEAEGRGDKSGADKLRKQDKQFSGHSNNYAATIGGPVILPKIYNGRNRLFFFLSFNGYSDRKTEDPASINRTFPTMANRRGDFSQLLGVNAKYQIHDPLSVRPDPNRPSHFIRDPIPGNVIPSSRIINPVYHAYLKILPVPNNDPADPKAEPKNNYLAVGTPYNWDYAAFSNRVDYQHSQKHRFFYRWSWNNFDEDRGDWTYETMRGLHSNGLNRYNRGATLDWVYGASPRSVFDFAVAANEFREGDIITVPFQFKPSDVGLPAYMDQKAYSQLEKTMLPQMNFAGYQSIGRGGVPTFTRYRLFTSKADISHIRGKHSARAGIDLRQHFRTGGGGGNTSGNFSFSNTYVRRNDDTNTPAGDLGLSWAAFMMGFPNGISDSINDSYALVNPYYAWFAQDSWRVSPKLTLTLGLRLEYELGPTERYNRMIAGFDPDVKLPISDAAEAAYARSPVAGMAPADFVVRGGAYYPDVNGVSRRRIQNELMWLPRLGLSYQVARQTILRAGYGIFFDTINVLNEGLDQTGFSRTTSPFVTTDFGMTWRVGDPRNSVSAMMDPFPVRFDGSRFDMPTREGLGGMARTGRGFGYTPFNTKHARQQRWRVGIQRQIGANMVFDVSYVGTYSDRLGISKKLDPLPEQYWADGLVRNNAVAGNLDANVTNPFQLANFNELRTSNPLVYQDLTTQGFFDSRTIRKHQLLRPFPQANGVTDTRAPMGEVRTHSLEVNFERRFSKGLNFNIGYTRLSDERADSFLNEFDARPYWREDGRPHRLTGSAIYELPFGKGRLLAGRGLPNLLFGGFQIAITYEYQTGPLLGFGNLFYYGDMADITKGERTLDRWFNTDNFERKDSKGPAAFHRRVFPTRIEGLRADITNQWNANARREFRIRERYRLEFRMDALNLQNRSQFNGPDTNPYSTNFGKITSQSAATNRFLQIQARLRF